MVLESHMKLCVTEPDFPEKYFFAPKVGKMGQKQGFVNFLKDLAINIYWICSQWKYILFAVPVWAKMFSANQIAGFSYQSCFQKKSMKYPDFLHVDANSHFWVGMVRNGCGQSGQETLKLTTSQEWIDGMNWFFVC